MFRTALCDMLGIEYPILLAGMGTVSRAELVAAVSNAGGLGILGGNPLLPQELRHQIRKTRDLTNKPFGVDLVLPAGIPPDPAALKLPEEPPPPLAQAQKELEERGLRAGSAPVRPPWTMELIRQQVEVILEENVAAFVSGLGSPDWVVPLAHAQGMKVMALVGNVRGAKRCEAAGVDIIVAQGHEAGGHTGRIGTLALVPQVVDAVKVPVVAAGGIADGRGLVAALALGACGALIGTRFIATHEANAHPNYKGRILESDEEGTAITKVYSGKTARHLRNRFIALWQGYEDQILPAPEQRMLVEPVIAPAREAGVMEYSNAAAGQIIGMIREIKSAREVVEDIIAEAQEIMARRLPQAVQMGLLA